MLLLFTIVTAFIIIYFYNWYLTRILIDKEDLVRLIQFLAPIVEEAVKTSLAVISGLSILLVHLGVGSIEGLFDFISKKKKGAVIAAILGHSLFGLLTQILFVISGYVIIGWIGGVILHVAWNFLVLDIKKI